MRSGSDLVVESGVPTADMEAETFTGEQLKRTLLEADTPTRIGRFIVLRPIGAGGMGAVYAAYDERLDRKVAIKVLRRGMSTTAQARVAREARAMARLTHPNVVQVYEVGEKDGMLFTAMEYVEGPTLDAWVRRGQGLIGWKEVLGAYKQAGRGLVAAHAAGLVHRDFKPTNVVVSTTAPGPMEVKVLDFGLAREGSTIHDDEGPCIESGATSPRLTLAGKLVGTPPYMAPEQWADAEVDEAADQYSFCVSLWEGLYRQKPFIGASMKDLREAVTKGNRTSPPRGTDVPAWLERVLSRGLSVSPRDRWPSMQALLDALDQDPARRRLRWGMGVLATAVFGVGVGGAKSGWDARARQCSGAEEQLVGVWDPQRRTEVESALRATGLPHAESVWRKTARDLDLYAQAWTNMHHESCEATTIRGEQSEAMMDLRMTCLHRAKVGLRAVVGVLATADAKVVARAHAVVRGLDPVSRCADLDALQAQVETPAPKEEAAVRAAEDHLAVASAEAQAGRYAAARKEVDAATGVLAATTYEPVLARRAYLEGKVLDALGEYQGAVDSLERAIELAGRSGQQRLMARAVTLLVYVVGAEQRETKEAMRLAAVAKGLATDPTIEAQLATNIGTVLFQQGAYVEAEAEHRRAIALQEAVSGPDDPAVAVMRNNLGNVLFRQGKYEEAEAEHRRVLALREKTLGPTHPSVASSHNNLGVTLRGWGRYAEAEAEYRQALVLLESALGSEHPDVAVSHNNLGIILETQGKYEDAEAEHRRALALREAVLGPEHPDVAVSHNNLGIVLEAQHAYADAEAEYRQALALFEAALGPKHPYVATARYGLGQLLHTQGRHAEAETEYREALAVWEATLGAEHPNAVESRAQLASVLLDRDRPTEALQEAEQAWKQLNTKPGRPEARGKVAFVLARAVWSTTEDPHHRARARGLAEQARKEFRDAEGEHTGVLSEIDVWLKTAKSL